MKNTRPAIAAVIAVSAALLFSGCASGGGSSATTTAAAGSDCSKLHSDVRDISNGAQNTLATAPADADAQTASASALADFSDQAKKLEDSYSDNKGVTSALDDLASKIDAGQDWVKAAPVDGSDADADTQASVTADIDKAATAVDDACKS
ncbi:hypothetical protein E6C70_11855 [Glaciibacter flavus]|uniref:Secreted protein n=1 Tax=Orlajensenia flava TaxID=2565934 RepID=A0A4S4FPH9_9MICO|nr:hypothetical protein [Glaciibacter flavus]THG32459.1 hypothetical protein E6C70_11855 [Glaciibacter flavus]